MTTHRSSSTACDRGPDLVAYLYGEASPAEAADIERHLQACAACRAELEGFRLTRAALQSWEMDAVAPRVQLVIQPTLWQAWRTLFAALPMYGRLATGAAAASVVLVAALALVSFRLTIGPQGVSLSLGRSAPPEAAAPSPAPGAALADGPARAPDDAALRRVVDQRVAERLAEQAAQRDAELEARLNLTLDARLKRQRADLLRLVSRLNREQRLQLAAWIQESELRSGPDLLDLTSAFPAAEGDE